MKKFVNYLTPMRFTALIFATIVWVLIAAYTTRAIFLDIVTYQKAIAVAVLLISTAFTVYTYTALIYSYRFFEKQRHKDDVE